MRLELTGRHVTITAGLSKAVERRLARMGRMLNDSIVSVQVVVTKEKARYQVEMTLHAKGDHFLHAAAGGRDVPTALGTAADKLEHQAQKLKSKWTGRKRQGVSVGKAGSVAEPMSGKAAPLRIVKARRYPVKPMSVDEAAFEVGGGQGAFLVFRNATTDIVNVLFRRPDGHLGLIEPDA